jgi:hypothetical protein
MEEIKDFNNKKNIFSKRDKELITERCNKLYRDDLKKLHKTIVGNQGGTKTKAVLIENILDNANNLRHILLLLESYNSKSTSGAKRKVDENCGNESVDENTPPTPSTETLPLPTPPTPPLKSELKKSLSLPTPPDPPPKSALKKSLSLPTPPTPKSTLRSSKRAVEDDHRY